MPLRVSMTAATAATPAHMEPYATWLAGDADALDLTQRMVSLLVEMPGIRDMETQKAWETAAWATIAIRRGRRDGQRITLADLEQVGLDPMVIKVAWAVGGDRHRDEELQRQTVMANSMATRIVWTVYWISRVRQARVMRKKSTWLTLAARAERETEAVLRDVAAPQRSWLQQRLDRSRW